MVIKNLNSSRTVGSSIRIIVKRFDQRFNRSTHTSSLVLSVANIHTSATKYSIY